MIHVSLTLLIFIYLFGFLSAVFGLWIWSEFRRQRRARQALRNRVCCSLCSFHFDDPSEEPLPRCPRCGAINERRQVSLL
jgi:uncharacterized paraquat-inducible protein A